MRVDVYSVVRPGLIKRGVVELGKLGAERTRQQCGIVAAMMAEELCEQHNDNLDPSAIARAALQAFRELKAENQTIPWGDDDYNVNPGRMATH